MTSSLRTRAALTQLAMACLFSTGAAVGVSAQALTHDTTTAATASRDLPLTDAQRRTYVGRYKTELPSGNAVTLRIFEERGALKLWASEPDESRRLLYQGDNKFLAENTPGFALEFVLVNGLATTITIRKEDGNLVANRIP